MRAGALRGARARAHTHAHTRTHSHYDDLTKGVYFPTWIFEYPSLPQTFKDRGEGTPEALLTGWVVSVFTVLHAVASPTCCSLCALC